MSSGRVGSNGGDVGGGSGVDESDTMELRMLVGMVVAGEGGDGEGRDEEGGGGGLRRR